MRFFEVKNFDRFQHYKDRDPPWIKLYNRILDDYEFSLLNDAERWHLIAIMLLASRTSNRIPWDPEWIRSKISGGKIKVDLDHLAELGFIKEIKTLQEPGQDASETLAKCLSRERDRDRDREEKAKMLNTMSGKPDDASNGKWNSTDEYLAEHADDSGAAMTAAARRATARRILAMLNEATGKGYKAVRSNLDPIEQRLKEDATERECRRIVAAKVAEWGEDESMVKYLRPETLFRRTKFWSYHGAL